MTEPRLNYLTDMDGVLVREEHLEGYSQVSWRGPPGG